MSSSAPLLRHLRNSLHRLRPSERKVADFILSAPAEASGLALRDLAAAVGVSEPTVMRLCQALGLAGYRQLCLELARATPAAGYRAGYERAQVRAGDNLEQIRDKTFDSALSVLQEVRAEVELDAIERAIELIDGASRVDLFAFGGSVPVAVDAQHKLFRLQITSAVHSDPHLQNMAASSLKPGDLVFALSNSGTTEALIRSVELVRAADFPVLAIAPPDTPLAQLATVALCVDPDEPGLLLMPLSARLAWLTLVDVLILGVARRRPQAQQHLTRLLQNQQRLRIGGGTRSHKAAATRMRPTDRPGQGDSPCR